MGAAAGPGRSSFSSVSHDDAAAAVVAALTVPAGIYNVADDQPLRHREFVDALADAIGRPAPAPRPGGAGEPRRLDRALIARSQRISNRKLRDASGWAPVYPSVREGFPAALANLH